MDLVCGYFHPASKPKGGLFQVRTSPHNLDKLFEVPLVLLQVIYHLFLKGGVAPTLDLVEWQLFPLEIEYADDHVGKLADLMSGVVLVMISGI